MNKELIIINNYNNDSKLWQVFIILLPAIVPIVWQEYKDYKEKKKLVRNLENAKEIIKNACDNLGIKNLTELPVLLEGKSLGYLINFYQEKKDIPSD